MNEPLPTDRGELLAELLAGVRSLDDPEVAARLRTDPTLLAEYRNLLAVCGRLDAAGDLEREAMAPATAAPGERARLAAAFERLAVPAGKPLRSGPSMPRRSGRIAFAVVGLLAAAGLLIYLLLDHSGPGRVPDEFRPLSGGKVTILAPKPLENGRLELSWEVIPALQGAKFDAALYDPARGPTEPLLERLDDERQTTWILEASEIARLVPGARLRVVAHKGGQSVTEERPVR